TRARTTIGRAATGPPSPTRRPPPPTPTAGSQNASPATCVGRDHVARPRRRALHRAPGARSREPDLVISADASVAILTPLLAAAPTADSHSIDRGPPVFALGSTAPGERRVAGGIVTHLGEFEGYWEYLLERGIVSSAANPGFGGGPLFTLTGQMVGVVSLNLNEIARSSLAIPTECYRRNQ